MDHGKLQTLDFLGWRLWITISGIQPGETRSAFQPETVAAVAGLGLVAMKNIYEVLRNKEMDLERLRIEVDALRFVAPLLADQTAESSDVGAMRQPKVAWIPEMQRNKWPVKMGHPGPTYSDS